MVDRRIEGAYVLSKNEGFYEYLLAQGVGEEKAKQADLMKPTIKISIEDENITFCTDLGAASTTSTLKINQEVEEKIALDMSIKSFTEVDGNRIIIYSKGPNGEVGTRDFEFLGTEMVMSLASDNEKVPQAKRYYRKL